MNQKLLSLFSLKWNPFAPEVPIESVYKTSNIEHFCWRVENSLIREGGFTAITGDPGTGKSVTLRILAHRLGQFQDLAVGVVSHPGGNIGNFYRQMGDIFGLDLKPNNRWGGFKSLRDRWVAHQETTLYKPVLLVDEAQDMSPSVMNELRHLSSFDFDSKTALSVIFAGDNRFVEKLNTPELMPLSSRLRMKMKLRAATPVDLCACLCHLMDQAGNKNLIERELTLNLAERSLGNFRALCTLANDLLMEAALREESHISEKLFFEMTGA